MFNDIKDFHTKFNLIPEGDLPLQLDQKAFEFRVKFMQEELDEFKEAYTNKDMEEQADALVDLAYVALGTACLMGLPFKELWDEVHKANMKKQRANSASESKRGSSLDVIKPKGWQPPNIKKVLEENK